MAAWSRSGIYNRRIRAYLQCTTVHHPATPTVENLGMAAYWSRSGIEELEPIYSAQQVHNPATPTVENLEMAALHGPEWDRRIRAHLQCTPVHHPATPTQLRIWGWLHGPGVG